MSSCCGRSLQNCLKPCALLYFYSEAIVFVIQPKPCVSICTVIGLWRDIELIECFSPCKRLESTGKLLVHRSTLCLTQDFFGGERVGSEASYWLYHHGVGWRPVGENLENSSRDQTYGREKVDKTAFKFVKGSRTERDELLLRAAEVRGKTMG